MPTKADGVTVDSTWTANMVSGKAKNEVQVPDVDSGKWNKTRSKDNKSKQLAPREVSACVVVDCTNVVHASTVQVLFEFEE